MIEEINIETFGPHFQVAEDGNRAFVTNVPDAAGRPVDRVAWLPEREGHWFLEHGVAVIAGEDAVRRAQMYGVPVILTETPAQWRRWRNRNHLQAACILDRRGDFERHFEGIEILALGETADAAARFKRKLDAMQREKILKRPLPVKIGTVDARTAAMWSEVLREGVRRHAA